MSTQAETRQLLVDTAERIFADHCDKALLDAADKGELRLTRTRIVVNCPVLRSADGSALAGLR